MKTLNKLAVLQLLQQQKASLSLPEIIHTLGSEYSERTVRRWLADMVTEGIVAKSGQKRSTRYFIPIETHAAKIESKKISGSPFSRVALKMIDQTRQPLYKRNPVSYNTNWIKQYIPNKTFYMTSEIVEQLTAAGQRIHKLAPAGTYARQIYNRLLIDLTYHSSRLEGNTYSLIDTERLLIEGASAEGKLDEEKIMILNHKEAIRYLVDNASMLQIDQNTIYTLHYLLADGLVPAKCAGKIRDSGVRISGTTYIPFENPTQLDMQLKMICNKASLIQQPYEQSLFLLIHIAYLQAFVDINKRTARLSSNIPLLQNNLVPLSFNDIEKDDYTSAMIAIYEFNDVRPLLELYVYSYLRTCKIYDATVESVHYDEVRVRYRKQRRDIFRHIITNELIGKKMQNYIQSQIKKMIDVEDQSAFEADLDEDLQEISPQRIAGLGITVQQLDNWLKKIKK